VAGTSIGFATDSQLRCDEWALAGNFPGGACLGAYALPGGSSRCDEVEHMRAGELPDAFAAARSAWTLGEEKMYR